MKLIDGLGQLGDALSRYDIVNDVTIYHTWDIDDKSKENQIICYDKFKKYVDEHTDERIIFISTLHEIYCEYLNYKLLAERYLLDNTRDGMVIRIPHLMGKGICANIRDKDYKPYEGTIEIDTIKNIAERILDCICKKDRLVFLHGEFIDAEFMYQLIRFGAGKWTL